jgi:hypothetical protein
LKTRERIRSFGTSDTVISIIELTAIPLILMGLLLPGRISKVAIAVVVFYLMKDGCRRWPRARAASKFT